MPIPLFNSIASWFLKKRIHQIQLFMKYPNEVQQELLHKLLNISSKTIKLFAEYFASKFSPIRPFLVFYNFHF